ncbi:MAG: hypothetical protein V7K68_27910 [Nostoc sp.]|uniref:hypothetical protein n=1 Tax=Nostoc sp. TaxID=1180 RepID=UPI002FFB506F
MSDNNTDTLKGWLIIIAVIFIVFFIAERKYRRLVVRWERQKVYFDAFIDLATIHIWINKILLVG